MATILLGTGDVGLQAVFEAELSGDGHALLWASDGKAAYELVIEQEVDLVLLDTSLPIYSGFETCSLLRKDPDISPALPVFLLFSERIAVQQLESVEASGQFAKKHIVQELRDLIAAHVDAAHFK